MARYKELFTLFPRKMKDGTEVWYYQTYDESGKRTSALSTGKKSEREAKQFCTRLYKDDKLIPKKYPTLEEWAKDRSWWVWGECQYCKSRLARSSSENPAISQRYAVDSFRTLKNHILPEHGKKRLNDITSQDCETLLFKWADEGYSMKTINNWSAVYRTMLSEAFRLGLIDEDPWKRVPLFAGTSKHRDTLSLNEAKKLLNPATVDVIWKGHKLYYLINLLASVTACRQGELLALKKTDLFPDHIQVDHSWNIKYGMGPTKTKVKAPIPIPQFVYDSIMQFAIWDGFIFSFTNGDTPATGNRITDSLYEALIEIGISQEERKQRNIVFHSWRKFFNTYLRSKNITDAKIQAVTRHASQEMTEHYTNFKIEDFKDVINAQEELSNSFIE